MSKRKNLREGRKSKGYYRIDPGYINRKEWGKRPIEQIEHWAALNGSIAVNNVDKPFYFPFLHLACAQVNYIEERKKRAGI